MSSSCTIVFHYFYSTHEPCLLTVFMLSRCYRTLDGFRADMSTAEICAIVGSVNFERYADKYFMYERKGLFKSKSSALKMLQWKNELIKMPLIKLSSPDLHKTAIQLFRNITGFMGDRKSSKPKEDHAQKILSNVITSPELFDEAFCQLCKQITKNPNVSSARQGWELMTLCLSVFPPSPDLLFPLLGFFRDNLISNEPAICKYADFCLHECIKRSKLGPKTLEEIPSQFNFFEGK